MLIATGVMNAGGAETLIMELIRQKSQVVEYIMLIHYEKEIASGVYDEEIQQLGVPIVYIPSVGSVGLRQYATKFDQVMQKLGKVDILHIHLNGVGGMIAKVAKNAGIHHRIVHCHANITFTGSKMDVLKNEIKLLIMKAYVNKYANHCWACSEEAGQRLFHKQKKICVIPNVINVNKYLMTPEKIQSAKSKFQMEGCVVIGAVGRISRIKNYELAIRLVAELKEKGKEVHFICFGRVVDQQYFDELMQMTRELGVMEQIHFQGNSTNVSFDIGCFDVFIMPSHSEGFGMAALEAQAAGLPTLVSTGLPKSIDMGINLVQFIATENIQEWVQAVLNVQEKSRVENHIILEGFNKKGFHSEVVVESIEAQYLQMENGE